MAETESVVPAEGKSVPSTNLDKCSRRRHVKSDGIEKYPNGGAAVKLYNVRFSSRNRWHA